MYLNFGKLAMSKDMDLIEVGRTAGAYGVRGWLRVVPHGRDGDFLFETTNWWFLPYPRVAGVQPKLLHVAEMKEHGKDLVVRLKEVATREDAMALKGSLLINPDDLPELEEGDYYDHDLLGLKVVNLAGETLGTVQNVSDNGAHDLLLVKPEGEGDVFMIPFVEAYVEEIDLEAGVIKVEWSLDWL